MQNPAPPSGEAPPSVAPTSATPPPAARAWEMPDAYLIIAAVVALAAALTWLIPAGRFALVERPVARGGVTEMRKVLDPDSFALATDAAGQPLYLGAALFTAEADGGAAVHHYFPADARGGTGLFNAAFAGLTSGGPHSAAVGVVAFILLIGGAFGIILRTGAVAAAVELLVDRLRGYEPVLIGALFALFSAGGAVFGMSEEAIVFCMLLLPVFLALGYDSLTVVLLTYGATQIGFATSWMNPFGVAIAQGLAEVPPLSGTPFRLPMWALFTAAGAAFTLWHARRVRRNPGASPVHDTDAALRVVLARQAPAEPSGPRRFRAGHGVVLAIVAGGIVWVVWGVVAHQYYIPEIASQFFTMGVLAGLVGVVCRLEGMRLNDLATSFRQGAGDLLGAALIVGFAKGIVIVLGGAAPDQPAALNTVLHWAGTALAPLPKAVAAGGMLAFQSALNFFVPSGSGQAALTMPLMAPLADFTGLTRQVAVLAFQLGDGLTNLIIPTSAALMGCLAVARIDYLRWLRFMLVPQVVLSLMALAAVLLGLATGLN